MLETGVDEKTDAASRKKVLDLVKGIDYAVFTTRTSGHGPLHARPMAYRSVEDDGDFWFFTKADSRKVQELKADPETMLTFADTKNQNFVSVSGKSQIVTDRAEVKKRWTELYRAWFPGGTDDDMVVLIRVEPEHAEYWDTPSGIMVYAYGYIKARVTGTPAKPGDVGAVRFN